MINWPFENDTKAIIKKLAKRSLEGEKRRNIMVTTAVILASFLISFAGGLAVSLVKMHSNQVKDTYEAVYSGITEQDINILKSLEGVARAGEYYLIGTQPSARGFTASFIYADQDMMYIGRQQMKLVHGRLPERADEIAVSESFQKEYAADAGIGDSISLDTESFQKEYTISGILEAADAEETKTYAFLVSKEGVKQWEGCEAAGYRAYVHLEEADGMTEEEMKKEFMNISNKYGLPDPAYHTEYFRWTFGRINFDSVIMLGLLAGLVLIGGCVVIQSIFRISVLEKIQSYGQLRTLGATKKQIMAIVKKESRALGIWGTAAGTLLGIGLAAGLVPEGFYPAGLGCAAAFAVIICLSMNRVSISRPVRLAAGISPVEAVVFVQENKKLPNSRRKHKRLAPFSLGFMNFIRDRKKTASILVSLSLGGIMFLVISSMLFIYSPRLMARTYFPAGDYKVYIDSDELADTLYKGNPLSERLRQQLLSIDGVEDVLVERQSVFCTFGKENNSGRGMGDIITKSNYSDIEQALVAGVMPENDNSIVLADPYIDYFAVGDSVDLSLGKDTKAVAVSGFYDSAKVTYAGIGHGALGLDGAMLYLPEALAGELLPGADSFDYSWDIVNDPAKDKKVKAKLETILFSYKNIAIDTFSDKTAALGRQYTTILHALQGTALLISLFGVINLVNTTLSNQVSRRHEVSMLRSVGLTKKQLYKLLTFEGMCYALFSIVIILAAGVPMAAIVCGKLSLIVYNEIISYQFPVLYMGIYIAVLFILELILSIWTIKSQAKYSLIEQLRMP